MGSGCDPVARSFLPSSSWCHPSECISHRCDTDVTDWFTSVLFWIALVSLWVSHVLINGEAIMYDWNQAQNQRERKTKCMSIKLLNRDVESHFKWHSLNAGKVYRWPDFFTHNHYRGKSKSLTSWIKEVPVIHFLSPNWAFSWHAPQWYYCTTAVPSQTCPPLLISLSHSVLIAEQVTARPASVDR